MKAADLYGKLDADFILSGLSDDWSQYMDSIADFLTDSYLQRSMGLFCDNSREITKVYTAVFPSQKVTGFILDRNETDILLFVHHPSIWEGTTAPAIFSNLSRETFEILRERRISIYNLHVPLDNYSEYSTSVRYARALGLEIEKPFGAYFGGICGVLARTDMSTLSELNTALEKAIGHRTGIYPSGGEQIRDGRVAVVAGGGMIESMLAEIADEGVHTMATGITVRNEVTETRHRLAEEYGISIVGGTHYSTEKFACIAMCEYFRKLGLPSEFIEDIPLLTDM